MLRIKLSFRSNDPLIRQTPGCKGLWDGAEFVLNEEDEGPFDHWFVLEDLRKSERALCSGGKTLVTWEPPVIRTYHPSFLRQFTNLITFRTDLPHPNKVRSHPLVPWWIGTVGAHGQKSVTLDYDSLCSSVFPNKLEGVSVVCSNKSITEGHRRRLDFISNLKHILGEKLHIFGPGFQSNTESCDKWDWISPFQYHLALENSSQPDYWTEKAADAFLGGAFLFYWGCPNMEDYFSKEAFEFVDREDPGKAASQILKAITEFRYAKARPAIETARRQVLESYNLFAALSRFAKSDEGGETQLLRLDEEAYFTRTTYARVKYVIKRVLGPLLRKPLNRTPHREKLIWKNL